MEALHVVLHVVVDVEEEVINFFQKLFLGENICREDIKESAILRRIKNLKVIWNGDDYGIERIVRLLLALSQFIFPGTYIRQIFGRHSSISRDISIDILVIFKICYSLFILKYDLTYGIYMYILLWFFLETLLYIPTLIFASDYLTRPRSYKRSMLLFFLNYIQINIDFGCIYMWKDMLNKPFQHWFDSIYFSLVSSNSIGFGDYYPITTFGKALVSIQAIFFLSFVILFLNFFSTKVKSKGYFDNEEVE